MRRQAEILLGVLVLVLFTSLSSAAKGPKTLTLDRSVTINGTQLSAGDYAVTWVEHSPQATVTFTRGKKVAATIEARWVDRPSRNESDSVVYIQEPDGSESVTEIRFAGMNRALVFGASPES